MRTAKRSSIYAISVVRLASESLFEQPASRVSQQPAENDAGGTQDESKKK
jgi:hypothetical protein